jgi:ATP-binding cassette subfamily F protein 2
MATSWHDKKNKQADLDFERNLQNQPDREFDVSTLLTDAAMGGGEALIFEKKQSKEEKKAAAKAKREAKKKARQGSDVEDEDDEEKLKQMKKSATEVLQSTKDALSSDTRLGFDDGLDHEQAEVLASAGTIVTYAASRKGVDARSRDINVQNVTLQHMGALLLDQTEVVLNHGNRYGLVGRNGCGKSTLLKALGARAIPIPSSIDIFFLKEEVAPSATMTAIEAVMSVDEERLKLEAQAEELNTMLGHVAENPEQLLKQQEDADTKTPEEVTEEIMEALNNVYERLDLLDAATAEVRARSILSGLGFTHEMQGKATKEFSGGWRMRVSLARALFIRPMWYVLYCDVICVWCGGCDMCVMWWM